jgi:hypothetical protein
MMRVSSSRGFDIKENYKYLIFYNPYLLLLCVLCGFAALRLYGFTALRLYGEIFELIFCLAKSHPAHSGNIFFFCWRGFYFFKCEL